MSSSESGVDQFPEAKVTSQYNAGPWTEVFHLLTSKLDLKLRCVLYRPRLPFIVLAELASICCTIMDRRTTL